ncbi:hypothetical protein S7711_04833 [Stachybotrys chartarum IBT 7711]|uniref:Uncharacterized protein n=1 Tax=Stachybotrys chartarum (strain CBS 109288 / IBT 7711) TaxID=1280523 RepID=A0A084AMH7_STACB|nr:hypothetical protein S7711_04833 [Stachybotrys chartarum IBT 7711]KFA51060.1 hypothetical protein S40293_08237 [Stachybotrys chartarum IBT 40293]
MGKKKRQTKPSPPDPPNSPPTIPSSILATTSAIAADPTLGYRIRVLIHDFLNVAKDPSAERRLNTTTDEHYISAPYFDDAEAAMVKAAAVDVDVDVSRYDLSAAVAGYAPGNEEMEDECVSLAAGLEGHTFDTAVRVLLNNFIDKRRASGDTRPCGPHHLAPMFASLFGIGIEEVKDIKFLGRLRRAGV